MPPAKLAKAQRKQIERKAAVRRRQIAGALEEWHGRRFGDESEAFVAVCDALWVLGGGPQSEAEARLAGRAGLPVTLVRGLGGAAERLTEGDVPSARVVAV